MAHSDKRWDQGVPWGLLAGMVSAGYLTFWGWREWRRAGA